MTYNLIVIAGPTAIGKSDVAFELAKRLNTEIISADSMQVYRYFNIGTAKPSPERQKEIQHHLIDIVVGNPPYRKADDGRINPDREKAVARHEIEITLSEFLKAGKYLLKNMGSLNIIYHPYRLTELLSLMTENKITPKRIQFVHPKIDSKAEMVMVEGIKNGKSELMVMKPLVMQGLGIRC